MRVLVTSTAGLGHVHPMVPLALALQGAGHDVRWLTGADGAERLAHAGMEVVSTGRTAESVRQEYRRRHPEALALPGRDVTDHVFPHMFGGVAAHALLAEALRTVEDWRPDLVINDAAEFAGPIAAARIGVPSVTHGFGALTPKDRVARASEQVAPLWRSVGLDPRPFAGLYDSLYLDIYPPSLRTWDATHVPRSQPLRPVAFDAAGDGPSHPWLRPAEGSDPLVYLTFGTVPRDPTGLRVALEGIASRRVRVLVTVGGDGDPAALGPQPEHVRVERYVPQTQVLSHCAVIASHAGSGTFLASLANAVPQLCLPQGADQFMNADASIASGTGLGLDPEVASADAIGDALDRLLTEPAFRDRARDAAAEIAAMPDPAAVVPVLEELAGR